MAYKFQLGTATLSGSIVAGGIADVTDEITGSAGVSASADITLAGTSAEAHTFVVVNESVVDAQEIVVSGGSGIPLAVLDDNNNAGRARLLSGSNTAVQIHQDFGTGSLTLHDATNGNTEVSFDAGGVSGSSNFEIGGDLTVGSADVQGNLTVNGSVVALTGSDVEVNSKITIDSGESTQANVTGSFVFGAGTGTGGARIKFASGSSEEFHLAIMNGDGTAGIAAHAELVGDGSQLSSVGNADSLFFGVVIKDSTASDDDKVLEAGKINIIDTFNNNTSNVVDLPGTASLTNGDIVSVKFNASDLGASKSCQIAASGSDVISIDGYTSIVIDSPYAALDLIYLGVVGSSGSFAIV